MSRLPFLNFCLLVFLITLLAIQHSVAVFRARDSRPASVAYEIQSAQPIDANDTGGQTSGLRKLLGYLGELWQRTMILREWIFEYQPINWQGIYRTTGAKADLAEARFHIANAEVFDTAMGETDRAEIELKRAATVLGSLRLGVGKVEPALDSIRKEVDAARIASKSISADDVARYERIKIDLDRLAAML